ncbi:MAG TPA: FHA domain-containing protein [Thermoanaerobaculia bacterium]|nr:FHA domain-containing protein [Thermoanaerobaculia bacterium]
MRVHFQEFVFDGEERRLFRGSEPLHLTPKAFELLRLLVEARPHALAKAELREHLWPDVIVDEANLKNLVVEIRNALGEDGRGAIRTVHRYGYAFTCDVSGTRGAPPRLIHGERTYELQGPRNPIGRGAACSIVIDCSGVSRRHALVRVEGDVVLLEDLHSKNGTWRNEERVQDAVVLDDGDRIRIGAATLIFRRGARDDTTTLGNQQANPA